MKVAAAFALPLVLAFVLVQTATRVVGVPEPPATSQPQSIVWADRVFVTHAEFARWLRARGHSYGEWALKHPALAAGKRPVEATTISKLDRDRTIRVLRSLVLGVALAALALLALAPLVYRLRRRRGHIYVPALAGHRRSLVEIAARPLSRSSNGGRPSAASHAAPPRRYGTPVFPRGPARRLDRFARRRGEAPAVEETDDAQAYGTPVFPHIPSTRLDRFLQRKGGWYVAAAGLGAGLGTLLGYVLA